VQYILEPMGFFSEKFPDAYFDCVFSVSTLEHIPPNLWVDVIKDMNRILKPGGRQLHAIDIPSSTPMKSLLWALWQKLPFSSRLRCHPLEQWRRDFRRAGVSIESKWPNNFSGLDRGLLVESYDVVFRFYPPVNQVKGYFGALSLLVEIRKDQA
jgi:SAM-dependent methyltransferase